jgi:hypothetical protein
MDSMGLLILEISGLEVHYDEAFLGRHIGIVESALDICFDLQERFHSRECIGAGFVVLYTASACDMSYKGKFTLCRHINKHLSLDM